MAAERGKQTRKARNAFRTLIYALYAHKFEPSKAENLSSTSDIVMLSAFKASTAVRCKALRLRLPQLESQEKRALSMRPLAFPPPRDSGAPKNTVSPELIRKSQYCRGLFSKRL